VATNIRKIALAEAAANKVDVDLIKYLNRNLKSLSDSTIVNLPLGERYYANEAQDDKCWVWSSFMPPGAYNFEVDDPLNKTVK
jgi:hypothetical protein